MLNLNANREELPAATTKPTTETAELSDIISAPTSIAASVDQGSRASTLSATAATTQRPTTPIPAKKFSAKKPFQLSLKISKTSAASATAEAQIAETENAALSCGGSSGNSTAPAASGSSSHSSATTTATSASTAVTIFPYEQHTTMKKLDIGFENISYVAKTGFLKRGSKDILTGMTGEFRAGQLNAIVGPSGAGKSTLLNILSSYTPFGYTGNVTINGNLRDVKAFKPNVAFITQDTSLQPFLTVKEAMHFAANLKIGAHMSKAEKRERVNKILEAMGMYENRYTRTMDLSGGQRKRLAIALELVNNPPVLVLDEPTSGLDSSTSNQCISLLKKLAMEGRTIICTIHQPSALTFQMFDHLYAIADGQCIYAGGTENLVPFLEEIGLHCKESYNPADYLMEIATNDYGPQNHKLVEKIQNGRNDSYRQGKAARKLQAEAIKRIDKMAAAGFITPVTAPNFPPAFDATPNHHQQKQQQAPHFIPLTPINEMSSKIWDSRGILSDNEQNTKEQQHQTDSRCSKPKKPKIQLDPAKLCKRENIYATPFYRQLAILLLRTFLLLWRDSSLTTMRFVIHFVTALLIGFLYYGIGNDAANAFNNFRYVFYTIMFIMYCAFSSILVKFPLEFPVVSREHFNRWYSLRAYYIAITLADIPIQLISTSLFIFITYMLTGQPWELYRLVLFFVIVFLTALVGQSIGLTVGASLSVKLGAIFGPFFICPYLVFSGFFLQYKDSPTFLQWMFDISFLRYSLDGAMLALFGYDRPKLECHDMYCHYSRPNIFLKDLGLANANYEMAALFLVVIFVGLRIIAFYIMSFRLRLFR